MNGLEHFVGDIKSPVAAAAAATTEATLSSAGTGGSRARRQESLRETTQRQNAEQARIMLGLLESVERDETQSQRQLATELGIALGLLNAYLKRCVRKGLVKMRRARRGATPTT